ncbi:MAG: hypothetical protein ACOZBH_04910 [Patescibacteria group bacterium]
MGDRGSNGVFPSEKWRIVRDIWTSAQVKLPKVMRWKKYFDHFGDIRRQDCLQHSYAIGFIADAAILMLAPFIRLDSHLLLTAFQVHDIGEGELGRDVVLSLKNKYADDDLNEYLAFIERYRSLPTAVFDHYNRAFLLQYCLELDKHQGFPIEAQCVMAELAETKRYEALAFHAIEIWDYLLYALEQYQTVENGYILHIVISGHFDQYEKLCLELPGFEHVFWTADVRAWCLRFLREHPPCPCGGYLS